MLRLDRHMFRIAVLGSPTSWYLKDLRRAAIELDAGETVSVDPVPFTKIAAAVGSDGLASWSSADNDGGKDAPSKQLRIDEFDALIVRSMPPGSLEQIIFRMDVLQRCEAAGQTVINPPRALETAIDKFLCLAKLQSAGFDVPETIACQTFDEAMAAFKKLGGDVVVKPLFGGEGRGITRIADEAFAFRSFRLLEQLGSVIYLQKFIPHDGADLRLFVIGDTVLGMRRVNPDDWRTNISLGARGEPLEITDELRSMAMLAVDAIGAPICAVDLLPGKDGRLYGLEVNAVPGWKALSKVLSVDVAKMIIRYTRSLAGGENRR